MRRIALFLALILTLGLAAGCGSQQAYVPTGHGLADQDAPIQPTGAAAPTLPPEDQHFRLAYFPQEGFNPFTCTNINNRMLMSLLYQGLFFVDRDYQAVPILCKSYVVSPNQRSHTFELERATFSDGTVLTAEDVVASLKAAEESSLYGGRFDNIAEIYAAGTHTVRIETYCAYENLPLLLDIPILKATELEAETPLGTGPYQLRKVASGMSLQKRSKWWCEAALPVSAESIPLMEAENMAQIRDTFEFDDLGISISDPGSSSYAEYRCDYELWEMETGIFLYLGCNLASPVFSNDNVRHALTYAINRMALLDQCYHGFGAVATLPASPSSPFYDRGLAGKVTYQPEMLRQALKDAGMVGQEIVLLVNKSDSVRLQTARMIKDMLTECGLEVTIQDNSTRYYKDKLLGDEYDLYLGQTRLSTTMDLTAFFAPYGALSFGDMDDPACYAKAKEALENSGNYYNLHQLILKDGQLVPLLFRNYAVYAVRGLAQNLQPSRDNVFFYSIGKTLEDIKSVQEPEE